MAASRTASVSIQNDLPFDLLREDLHLDHGIWGNDGKDLPPDVIPAGERRDFGGESDGFLTGTEGWVSYEIKSWPGTFTVRWNVPWVEGPSGSFVRAEVGTSGHGIDIQQSESNTGSTDHMILDMVVTIDTRVQRASIGESSPSLSGVSPTATAWGRGTPENPERIDVFLLGQGLSENNLLLHTYFPSNSAWSPFESIAGATFSKAATLASCSWGNGRLDVFGVDVSGTLQHTWYDESDGGWGWWDRLLRAPLSDEPGLAAASWSKGRIDVFAKGDHGQLMHLWFEGSWSDWEDLDGKVGASGIGDGIGVVPAGAGRLNIFAINESGQLQLCGFSSGTWTKWHAPLFAELEGPSSGLEGSPSGVMQGNQLQVYAKARDGAIFRYDVGMTDDTTTRTTVIPASENRWGALSAVSDSFGRVDLFSMDRQVAGLEHHWSKDGGTSFKSENPRRSG